MTAQASELLSNHKLRKTDMRLSVLQVFLHTPGKAITQSDLDQHIDNADRITLYRTLKTFEENGIIHQAVDGTGTTKYALCNSHSCTAHKHTEKHAHFLCNDCGTTLCLDEAINPDIKAPKGFEVEESYLVLKGRCKDCSVA